MNKKEPAFDLFVSYNSKDYSLVRPFVTTLKSWGVCVWIDKEQLSPGKNFINKIQTVLEGIPAVAVCIGPSGFGPWQKPEMNAALVRMVKQNCTVIPVLLKGGKKIKLPPFMTPLIWVDLEKGLDKEILLKAIAAKNDQLGRKITKRELRLHEIIKKAKKRLIVSGHTLDKFAADINLKAVLLDLLARGVKVTFILLNPLSKYAEAHRHFHELESNSRYQLQQEQALEFFRSVLEGPDERFKENIEILFCSYMPRFRTIIVDDDMYLYLYMYGHTVSSSPDLFLRKNNDSRFPLIRNNVLLSINKLQRASQVVSFIRYGKLYDNWRTTKIANWGNWTQAERTRHRITHDYYEALPDALPNTDLEEEVRAHLDQTRGQTLVLGCGSGKEVEYLCKHRDNKELWGVDSSPRAIQIVHHKFPNLKKQFFIGDYYDTSCLFPDKKFDTIVANAALVHLLNRKDIDKLLRDVWGRLRPGGMFFLRMLYKERCGQPVREEEDSSGHDLPRWFVYYSRSELSKKCQRVGFKTNDRVTMRIAKEVTAMNGRSEKVIIKKGFPHIKYPDVYWPTLLLEKPIRKVGRKG